MKLWSNEEQGYIRNFINRVHALLPTNQCTFARSEKNNQFDYKYNLRHEDRIRIIKSIEVDDCIDICTNNNPRYSDADVFVFLKSVELNTYGETENTRLYIKEYIATQNNMEMVVVISFHEEGLHDL